MNCSSVQGKMQSPLFSASLQSRLTAGSVSLQLHLWRVPLHKGCSDPAQMSAALSKAKCNHHCSVLLCKAGSQQAVCHCSYTCGGFLFTQVAVTYHKCTAALSKANCNPLFSAALQKRLKAGSVSRQLLVEVCSSHRVQ